MVDATVSARVPVEVKKQADKKLRQMGSSTTELINAAYDYLIAEGHLPQVHPEAGERDTEKSLSPEQLVCLRDFFSQTTFEVEESLIESVLGDASPADSERVDWDGRSGYKSVIASGRLADYEALA